MWVLGFSGSWSKHEVITQWAVGADNKRICRMSVHAPRYKGIPTCVMHLVLQGILLDPSSGGRSANLRLGDP